MTDNEEVPNLSQSNGNTTSAKHLRGFQKSNRKKWHLYEDVFIFTWYMMAGSFCGVIARHYLEELSQYSGFSSYEALWPNIVGCFFMGIVTHHKHFLVESHGLDNLHMGLGTAFCGSLTTFSSWNEEASLVLVDFNHSPQFTSNVTTQIFTWLNILLSGFCTSYCSLLAGFHFASLSPWGNEPSSRVNLNKEYRLLKRIGLFHKQNELLIASITVVVVTAVVIAVPLTTGSRSLTFEALLGFPGALLRYVLGRELNKPTYPWGTFTANMVAVTTLCGFHVWQVSQNNFPDSQLLNDFFIGITDGFCGSLSTVSTFMNETFGLKRSMAWRYVFASLACGQAISLVILGTYTWV
eukprot:CFRG0962T1